MPQENDWFFFYARDCTPRIFSNIISLPRRYIKKKKVKFIFLSKKHERCNGSRQTQFIWVKAFIPLQSYEEDKLWMIQK